MSEAISPAITPKPLTRGWDARRVLMIAGLAVVLLIAGAILTLVAQRFLGGGISANELRITTYQDWRVLCPAVSPATPNCTLSTEVTNTGGGAAPAGTILSLQMTDPVPNSNLTVIVPHGVLLQPGLAFTIGNDPMRIRPYETCTNAGCIALVTVDADTLKSLRTNTGGRVTIAVPNSQQPLGIPFSLKGFVDAYGDFQREHARRTGFFGFLMPS